MDKRKGSVPKHARYPLVLKLWKIGKPGENEPIRSIRRLSKITKIAYTTIVKWRDEGWLDVDLKEVAELMKGTKKPEDIQPGKKKKLSADDLIESSTNSNASSNKKSKNSNKNDDDENDEPEDDAPMPDGIEESNEIFDSIMTRPIEVDMEELDRRSSVKRNIVMVEFPSADKVLHDVEYFQKPGSFYEEKNHQQWLADMNKRLRRVAGKSLGQLESLVDSGKVSSKSAQAALGVAREATALTIRLSKEIQVDSTDKPLTVKERRDRVRKNQNDITKAIDEAGEDDISESTLRKRLGKMKKQVSAIPDDDTE